MRQTFKHFLQTGGVIMLSPGLSLSFALYGKETHLDISL
uniref:Uncharacterized protein n=1 Tax=Anguilla anguilla TaxID=7936 RepID=A0A0E9T1H9_ANGAN